MSAQGEGSLAARESAVFGELQVIRAELQARLDALRVRLARPERLARARGATVLHDLSGSRTRSEIRMLERVLERLDAGAYGLCELCGGEISLERLDALPHATTCAGCARA